MTSDNVAARQGRHATTMWIDEEDTTPSQLDAVCTCVKKYRPASKGNILPALQPCLVLVILMQDFISCASYRHGK